MCVRDYTFSIDYMRVSCHVYLFHFSIFFMYYFPKKVRFFSIVASAICRTV